MKTDERMKKDGKQKTPFAWGYRWGVQTYRKYPKADKAEQKRLSEQIDGYKELPRAVRGGASVRGSKRYILLYP